MAIGSELHRSFNKYDQVTTIASGIETIYALLIILSYACVNQNLEEETGNSTKEGFQEIHRVILPCTNVIWGPLF